MTKLKGEYEFMDAPFSRVYFDLLRERARHTPTELAVICGQRQVAYGELESRACKVATGLRRIGVRRGDRVALLINNRLEWLEIVFGASALGAVVIPLSTWSRHDELKYLLDDAKINVLFALAGFSKQDFAAILDALVPECASAPAGEWRSEQLPYLRAIIGIDAGSHPGWFDYGDFVDRAGDFVTPPPGEGASAGDDLFVLYTSGTSSRPKAVRILHLAAIENGFNIGERQGLRRGDRVFLAPPLFWYYAAGNAVIAALSHSATLVLQGQFAAGAAIEQIEGHHCTAIYTLPNITRAIIQHPDFHTRRTRSLRTGLTIGTPDDVRLAAEVLAAPSICNVYGLTETYGNCCVTWSDAPLEERTTCQGPPLPGFKLQIVDPESRAPLATGSAGEVEVSGYISPGYAGESGNLYNASMHTVDGYFRTGDVGYLDSQNSFHFVGRNNEMIKTAGINVSPAEVELILQQHPAIAEAAVVGVASIERGEDIVAFAVKKN